MSSSQDNRRSRGVRVLGIGFLLVFLLLAIGAAVIYFGWNKKPEHWTQTQERIAAMSDDQRNAISTSLRNRVITEFSDSGGQIVRTAEDLYGHQRTVALPYEQLNVWLAQEGTTLLADIGIELPGSVKAAMVDSPGDGLLRISCDFDNGSVQQIVALTFEIEIDKEGTVTSSLQEAVAGTLPMPAQSAIDLIAKRSGGGEAGGRMLGMLQGTPFGPVDVPIDKARSGRLVGIQVNEDALVITRRTVRRVQTD